VGRADAYVRVEQPRPGSTRACEKPHQLRVRASSRNSSCASRSQSSGSSSGQGQCVRSSNQNPTFADIPASSGRHRSATEARRRPTLLVNSRPIDIDLHALPKKVAYRLAVQPAQPGRRCFAVSEWRLHPKLHLSRSPSQATCQLAVADVASQEWSESIRSLTAAGQLSKRAAGRGKSAIIPYNLDRDRTTGHSRGIRPAAVTPTWQSAGPNPPAIEQLPVNCFGTASWRTSAAARATCKSVPDRASDKAVGQVTMADGSTR